MDKRITFLFDRILPDKYIKENTYLLGIDGLKIGDTG